MAALDDLLASSPPAAAGTPNLDALLSGKTKHLDALIAKPPPEEDWHQYEPQALAQIGRAVGRVGAEAVRGALDVYAQPAPMASSRPPAATDPAGFAKWFNWELANLATGSAAALLNLFPAGIEAARRAFVQALKETGVDSNKAESAGDEAQNFANFILADMMAGAHGPEAAAAAATVARYSGKPLGESPPTRPASDSTLAAADALHPDNAQLRAVRLRPSEGAPVEATPPAPGAAAKEEQIGSAPAETLDTMARGEVPPEPTAELTPITPEAPAPRPAADERNEQGIRGALDREEPPRGEPSPDTSLMRMPQRQPAIATSARPGANWTGFIRPTFDPTVERLPHPLRREKILADFARRLGAHIYYQRIKGRGVMGFYRPKIEEVRVKRYNDLEVAAHEIAHLLDDRDPEIARAYRTAPFEPEVRALSYDQRKLNEGFAEFLRFWMTQPERLKAFAPQFMAWWEQHLSRAPYGADVAQTRADMQAWFSQPAVDRLASKIGVEQDYRNLFRQIGARFRQSMLDDLHGIYLFEKGVTGEIAPGGAYETARLTRGARAAMMGAIRHGVPVWRPDGSVAFVGKGLEEIFAPVADHLQEWVEYAVARSAAELKAQSRENLIDDSEIEGGLAHETSNFGSGFRQAFDEYQEWNKGIVDFAEQAGIVDPARRAEWQRMEYLPFYRIAGANAEEAAEIIPGSGAMPIPGLQRGVRRLTGGTANLRPLFENILNNAWNWIHAAYENDARQKVADLADKSGAAAFMVKIPKEEAPVYIDAKQIAHIAAVVLAGDDFNAATTKDLADAIESRLDPFVQLWQHGQVPHDKAIVAVLRGGKPDYYKIGNQYLYRAMSSLNRPNRSSIVNALAGVRRLAQAGVTLHPEFLAAHWVRDAIQGRVLSDGGFAASFNSFRGLWERMAQTPEYWEYLANGGGFVGSHLDEIGFRHRLEAFHRSRGIDPQTVLDSARKVSWALESIADAFGGASRLGEYARLRSEGVGARHAAYVGREISGDFAMRGDSRAAAFFYDTVAFLNASVVSMDRLARGIYRSEENRARFTIGVIALAMASIGLWAWNRQFKAYRDHEDWDKDLYWHVMMPGSWFGRSDDDPVNLRIPKAWEIGLVSTLAERTAEYALTDESSPKALKQMVFAILQVEHLDLVPSVLVGPLETTFNYNFMTGRPAMSESTAEREPWMQATPGTSSALQKFGELESGLPTWAQVSPVHAETYLHAYLGNWATTGLWIADRLVQHAPQPRLRADEYPFARRFYEETPARSTRYIDLYYRALDEAMSTYATFRAEILAQRPDLARKTMQEQGFQNYSRLVSGGKGHPGFNRSMTAINKLQRDVLSAPSLEATQSLYHALSPDNSLPITAEDWQDVHKLKRILVDELYRRRDALAEEAVRAVHGE